MVEPINIKVVEAETVNGGVLVHFSNQVSVLYHAQFLYDVQHDDGNIEVSSEITDL